MAEIWLDEELNPVYKFDYDYNAASELKNARDIFSNYDYEMVGGMFLSTVTSGF